MKVCVFSDVHGNTAYLDACLDVWETCGFDDYIFLGDAVGYFPDWRAALTRIASLSSLMLMGNHDAMAAGAAPIDGTKDAVYRLTRVRDELTAEERAEILARSPSVRRTIDGRRCWFVHGTPQDPLFGYGTEESPAAAFSREDTDFLFMGQTHHPWIRVNERTTVVNVGSVGLPRDMGCAPSWAEFDTESGQVTIQRLMLDIGKVFPVKPDVHESVWACILRTGSEMRR